MAQAKFNEFLTQDTSEAAIPGPNSSAAVGCQAHWIREQRHIEGHRGILGYRRTIPRDKNQLPFGWSVLNVYRCIYCIELTLAQLSALTFEHMPNQVSRKT